MIREEALKKYKDYVIDLKKSSDKGKELSIILSKLKKDDVDWVLKEHNKWMNETYPEEMSQAKKVNEILKK